MADLPCLTTDIFDEVLAAAPTKRPSFVSDVIDQGSTMLFNPPSVRMAPCFGDRSARAHGASATKLPPEPSWLRARQDVDTLEDLVTAAQLGLGACTRSLWERRLDATSMLGDGAEIPRGPGETAGQDASIVGL